DWSASSRAYASPEFLTRDAQALIEWSRTPTGTFCLEAGADTGRIRFEFYTIDRAAHARCAITLATRSGRAARPAETWRLQIELPTELGLIEQFARECIALRHDFTAEAFLSVLPA